MSLNGRLENCKMGGCKEIRQPFANPLPTLRQPFANLSPTLCQTFLPTPLQPPLSVDPRHPFRDTGLTASWLIVSRDDASETHQVVQPKPSNRESTTEKIRAAHLQTRSWQEKVPLKDYLPNLYSRRAILGCSMCIMCTKENF